ncbi:PREDICTED: leukotriene A-4 hydrolase [Hipposideros armiger]|uniref:Leukotriene A-4 hydrolase n=1 Tax=Hipposideros armiger TaxID=186990 RepID=A0A8B7RAM7_HIPAR|nr:PREDICTED: leukotriene A-4 hydrolase [Hipposideros armiger]
MPEIVDSCSLASPASVCQTKHLHLRCSVDFTRQALTGTAALTIQSQEDNLRSLVRWDERPVPASSPAISLSPLTLLQPLPSPTSPSAPACLGIQILVRLNYTLLICLFVLYRNQEVVIEISFETSPKSSALQWLTPEQTSGKRHPYLFSQCQAIHCRAILPCQDTPSVKLTYTAEVSVPKELVALMSAIRDGEALDPGDSSRKIYRFNQKVPIPCYLIALVVGALESRQIGPRTLVWSEKEQVEKSAYEFSETESMLKIAEDLGGPYVWGQYDLLVLPPSFPYGGMENPCLTFVTPTLLVDILNQVDWNTWLYSPGLPPVKPKDLAAFDKSRDQAIHTYQEHRASMHPVTAMLAPLPLGHIKRMQEVYNFNAINNSEIRFRWLRLCIQSKWEEAIPLALKMVTEQGRMKFTRPLFKDLAAFDKSRDQAIHTYQEHRASMHPVTAMLVGKDLKVD